MDNIQSIFEKLTAIDSETGHEDDISAFITEYVIENDLADTVNRDQHNNIYIGCGDNSNGVFFSAHLDTVKPGQGIKAVIKDGYYVSEGDTILGADNKAAVAAYLDVLQLRHDNEETFPYEVVLTVSEEVDNFGAYNFDYSQLQAKKGFCFDLSEPVGTITTASPFYERFDVTILGKSAHASRPEEAINAMLIFKDIVDHNDVGKLDNMTVMNIGTIESGTVRNTIPGKLTFAGDLRSFKEENLEKHKKNFIQSVKKIVKKHKADVEIEFVRENPGYFHDSPAAMSFIKDVKGIIQELEIDPNIVQTWGVSDANIFNEKERMCLNLGDGSEYSHSTKERIKVSELENISRLVHKFAKQLTAQ